MVPVPVSLSAGRLSSPPAAARLRSATAKCMSTSGSVSVTVWPSGRAVKVMVFRIGIRPHTLERFERGEPMTVLWWMLPPWAQAGVRDARLAVLARD